MFALYTPLNRANFVLEVDKLNNKNTALAEVNSTGWTIIHEQKMNQFAQLHFSRNNLFIYYTLYL